MIGTIETLFGREGNGRIHLLFVEETTMRRWKCIASLAFDGTLPAIGMRSMAVGTGITGSDLEPVFFFDSITAVKV